MWNRHTEILFSTEQRLQQSVLLLTWVRMEGSNLNPRGGDSGGPVFANNTAYGIVAAGAAASDNGGRGILIFTPIDRIEQLGYRITQW